jgi:16S rRNA G527 N7-methylase RsmG
MVESKLRKAAFLREAAGSLSLDSTRVLPVRVEELEGHADPGSLDLLTTRGLRLDPEMIRVAASLLRPGGRFLVFGSKAWPAGDRTFDPIERVLLAGGESILQILGKPG